MVSEQLIDEIIAERAGQAARYKDIMGTSQSVFDWVYITPTKQIAPWLSPSYHLLNIHSLTGGR